MQNIIIDGATIQAKHLGSGLFCDSYIDRDYKTVYLFCESKEKSKDILMGIKHKNIPYIIKHTSENKKQSIFSMPYYRMVKEEHLTDVSDFLTKLSHCLRSFNSGGYNFKTGNWMTKHKSAYMYIIGTYGKNIPDSIREATTIIMEKLEKTSDMRWYLDSDNIDNFGLDNNDNLILRDILVVAKDLRWVAKKELSQSS